MVEAAEHMSYALLSQEGFEEAYAILLSFAF
jgi:hypothetical protein